MAKASKGVKAGADYLQGAWKLIPASFSVSADPWEPPIEIEGGIAVNNDGGALQYSFPVDPAQNVPVEIRLAKTSSTDSGIKGTAWLTAREREAGPGEVGITTPVDVEVVEIDSGKVVGGRSAGSGMWFLVKPLDLGTNPVRVTRLPATKAVASGGTSSAWFKQEPGTWPPAAHLDRSTDDDRQFGFDTRIHDLSVAGQNVSGGLRVLPTGTKTTNPTATLSRPVDVWGITESQLNGNFGISRASIVSSRNGERPPEDLLGKLVFTAPPMKAVAAGTVITYTHKLLYVGASTLTPFGYLRVESTGASLALVWFANEAVSIGAGEFALNPVRDIYVSKATTPVTITLPAGNWYAARSARYTPV